MRRFVVRIDHGTSQHRIVVLARSHEEAFAEAERVLGISGSEGVVLPENRY